MKGPGEPRWELVTHFPLIFFFSDFNLPRERSFFGGQRVHLPELGRGGAKLLLRRHRGGAVDGGGCECLTRSDSLSCFLPKMSDSFFFLFFRLPFKGVVVKTDYVPLLQSLAPYGWRLMCVLPTPIVKTNRYTLADPPKLLHLCLKKKKKSPEKKHPFSCKFVSFPTTSPKFSEDSLPRLSHSVGDFGTKHCGLETRQMV